MAFLPTRSPEISKFLKEAELPKGCTGCRSVVLLVIYAVFLTFFLRSLSSDPKCAVSFLTLSGWYCFFWWHAVNILWIFFSAFTVLSTCYAAFKAETNGGSSLDDLISHTVNTALLLPWSLITWYRFWDVAGWFLPFDVGSERPQWIKGFLGTLWGNFSTALILIVVELIVYPILLSVCFASFPLIMASIVDLWLKGVKPEPHSGVEVTLTAMGRVEEGRSEARHQQVAQQNGKVERETEGSDEDAWTEIMGKKDEENDDDAWVYVGDDKEGEGADWPVTRPEGHTWE